MSEKIIPKFVLEGILSHGCGIFADRQMGKTNLAKIIVAEMSKLIPTTQHKVFDTAQVWRHSFLSSFKMQEINERTRQVWNNGDDILFDLEYTDSEQIMQFMGNTVLVDYLKMRERKKASRGILNDWIVYTLEEAHNSLGSYSLNRVSGRFWLKAISEGANFNLAYILIGQRPADISTKAVERMQSYFIGRTTGDNNTRKLKGIVGKKAGINQLGQPLYEKVKTLKRGEFVFWNGETSYLFETPKFEEIYPNQTPEMVIPPKKKWLKLW